MEDTKFSVNMTFFVFQTMIVLGHPLCLNHSGVIPQAFLLLHFNTQGNFTTQFQHNYFASFLQGAKYLWKTKGRPWVS